MGRCDQGRDAPAYLVARAEEGVASLARPTRPEPDTLRAPMAPATAVPWPLASSVAPPALVRSTPAASAPSKCGLASAMPESTTATVTSPPLVSDHARSIPIWETIGGAVGMSASRPSSQLAIALS